MTQEKCENFGVKTLAKNRKELDGEPKEAMIGYWKKEKRIGESLAKSGLSSWFGKTQDAKPNASLKRFNVFIDAGGISNRVISRMDSMIPTTFSKRKLIASVDLITIAEASLPD